MSRHAESRSSDIRGTREWAVADFDCWLGCPHGCRYCYARRKFVEKEQLVTAAEWQVGRPLLEEVHRPQPKYSGQVMFPAHHDIVPENFDICLQMLAKLLQSGNRVLVVSKPHRQVIKSLCRQLAPYRSQILFRFTIGTADESLLHFWEPGAPSFAERKECLEIAAAHGFATSVSIEPMLEPEGVVNLVAELLPLVSHSIWLGKMNKMSERVKIDSSEMAAAVATLIKGQEDGRIRALYQALKGEPKVRWKDSIKKVVGIDLVLQPGLDI